MLDYQNDQFKSLEELKEIAPQFLQKKVVIKLLVDTYSYRQSN